MKEIIACGVRHLLILRYLRLFGPHFEICASMAFYKAFEASYLSLKLEECEATDSGRHVVVEISDSEDDVEVGEPSEEAEDLDRGRLRIFYPASTVTLFSRLDAGSVGSYPYA